jgi:DNA (cytosine-5)-methyltransferase 1
VIENVPPAIHDRTQVVQSTAASLRDMGYFVDWGVLHARSLGVAQRRRRFFLLASKVAQPNLSEILSCSEVPDRSLEWACADLMDIDHPRGVFDSSAVHSAENRRRIDFLFDNDLHDLPNAERPDCHRLKPHSYTSVYGRMYWDRPAPTITSGFGSTGQGRFVHPHRRRTLTPHEAARVQFIPDFFKFGELGRVKLQKMIGNAVPPKLSYAVTLHLLMNEMEAACRP